MANDQSTKATDLVRAVADIIGNTGDEHRAAELVDACLRSERRAGLEAAVRALVRLWDSEHDKGPDERMGDGSLNVIRECMDAIRALIGDEVTKP